MLDRELLFSPTDWPLTLDSISCTSVSNELRRRYDMTTELGEHVSSSFAMMVEALMVSKREGVFVDGVFLTVFSGESERAARAPGV